MLRHLLPLRHQAHFDTVELHQDIFDAPPLRIERTSLVQQPDSFHTQAKLNYWLEFVTYQNVLVIHK